jgi:hypothetical protein
MQSHRDFRSDGCLESMERHYFLPYSIVPNEISPFGDVLSIENNNLKREIPACARKNDSGVSYARNSPVLARTTPV